MSDEKVIYKLSNYDISNPFRKYTLSELADMARDQSNHFACAILNIVQYKFDEEVANQVSGQEEGLDEHGNRVFCIDDMQEVLSYLLEISKDPDSCWNKEEYKIKYGKEEIYYLNKFQLDYHPDNHQIAIKRQFLDGSWCMPKLEVYHDILGETSYTIDLKSHNIRSAKKEAIDCLFKQLAKGNLKVYMP